MIFTLKHLYLSIKTYILARKFHVRGAKYPNIHNIDFGFNFYHEHIDLFIHNLIRTSSFGHLISKIGCDVAYVCQVSGETLKVNLYMVTKDSLATDFRPLRKLAASGLYGGSFINGSFYKSSTLSRLEKRTSVKEKPKTTGYRENEPFASFALPLSAKDKGFIRAYTTKTPDHVEGISADERLG